MSRFFYIFLWFLGIIGSQFYVFSSGLPQPSHIIFAVIILFTAVGFFTKDFDKKDGGFYKYLFCF